MSTLSCNSLDFISFNKISKEIILHNISIDVNFITRFRDMSDELGCFIVQTSPEKGSNSKRYEFIKHVISGVWSLILRIWPMFNSNLFACMPIWERTDIPSSKNIFYRCLQIRITDNTTIFILRNHWVWSCKKFSSWLNSHSNYYNIARNFFTIFKNDSFYSTLSIFNDFFNFLLHMKLNTILTMFRMHHFAYFFSKSIWKWILFSSNHMNLYFITKI